MRYQFIMTVVMAGAGIGFGVAGCGQNKISECNALIEVINKGVAAIEKGQKPDKAAEPSAADLKAMADTMDKVATEAAAVKLTIPELQKHSTDYQAMAKEVSKALRDLASAVEAKDNTKVTEAQAAVDKANKQEQPLIDSLNKFCQAP